MPFKSAVVATLAAGLPMLFNSVPFFLLLVPTLLLYYVPFMQRFQLHVIIAASFIFYAYNMPWLLLLLIVSLGINTLASHAVVFGRADRRKMYATVGVTLNLVVLILFKYSPLIGRSFFEGSGIGEFLIAIPLPVGISFFTFQGISLVVDAYRGKDVPDYASIVVKGMWEHTLRISTFIAFFAQLVAGPVVKAHEFLPQVRTKYFKDIAWNSAFASLVVGYFLKMVVADNLKDQTFWITFPYFKDMHSITLLVLLFGYSMQIFADFAGYSLIAIGLARLFGYILMDNFDFPYIAATFSEFWRRWHISLSSFLREYLYIPLGGNRMGGFHTYKNLMITMVLGGLWHGAAWSYAVWGFFHGLVLALERLTKDLGWSMKGKVPRFLHMLFIFTSVTFAWLLFKLPEFDHVIVYVRMLLQNTDIPNIQPIIIFFTALFSVPVVAYHLLYLWTREPRPIVARIKPIVYGGMLFLILVNSGGGASFIYFQF
ncbi:MAG TPA: MBOAT family O-acyltransferase [Flavobacteriales bacterium]|jgi:alginate O-acetyltransferase complex protein AlgI|nr:MBOAT family protein [Flavobacteriales bacterium]MBP9176170.1 MBOAT family protein [Flavobacteriales bacterium]HQW04713.1 MBOAT family O-acyltransferase [Flavobacteriales bacterium]HQW97403.1 MBOAT family O-acyltransferase [Flavobacteriales bacterium]